MRILFYKNMKTEAQRSPVTCPRSHSGSMTPWTFAYSSEFHLLRCAEVLGPGIGSGAERLSRDHGG